MDADIEKASDDRAEREHDHRPEVEWDGSPVLRIEDGFKHGGAVRPTRGRQFDRQP